MEYEAVIGLEVHVQLKTKSKMFTRAPYKYGEAPNTLTNGVVLALPGTLPVLNAEAIRKTIKVGLMFGSKIADICKWDRKNYFYPDSPKGYQLSQFDQPVCLGGSVEIELPGSSRNIMGVHRHVQLTRIHLEEDVGKLSHMDGHSLVDYNRAGAPLIEIVTEPDMSSAEEVFAFLTALRNCMLYAGVADCDMEKGQMRCDANVSVRPVGSTTLGTKVEIKNLNSISGVRNGVIYEIQRQIQAINTGEKIIQETRRWNAEEGYTSSMRGKEQAHDYRYFPDPDLMPVKISSEMKETIQSTLPELPFDKQRRFMEQYDLPYTITSVLCPIQELCHFYEKAIEKHNNPKAIGNIIANDLLRELSSIEGQQTISVTQCKITPDAIAGLIKLVDDGIISKQTAQEVFVEMYQTGKAASIIVKEKGLEQTSDTGELERICGEAIAGNTKAVEEFRSGKDTAINALKGHVMKVTKGKANPKMIDDILRKLLQ